MDSLQMIQNLELKKKKNFMKTCLIYGHYVNMNTYRNTYYRKYIIL